MYGILRDIITSPAGSFAFVFSLLALAFSVVYYVTKHISTINANHNTLSKSTEKLDAFMDELRKDMAYVKGTLELRNDLAQSHSPVSLTEKGKDASIEMKAEERIANNWDKIYSTLEEEVAQKNAYDIQQYCIETAAVEPEKFFAEKDLEELKLFAYQKGKTYHYFSMVLAILIRDKYFEMKGIATSDIDKYHP